MGLNLKDKKILYELEKDARITNSLIARKVGLSKDAVGYRIKQLEEKGIIKGYRAIIDVNKNGEVRVLDVGSKIKAEKKERKYWNKTCSFINNNFLTSFDGDAIRDVREGRV